MTTADDDVIREQERRKGETWGRLLSEHDAMLKSLSEIKSEVGKIRETSDALYAFKFVEKGFIALVSLLCLAVVGALLKLVVKP